jgi:tetratricopeptide (TPR) repeat protein
MAGDTEQCARINIELDRYLASDDSRIKYDIYDAKFINAFYSGDYDTADRMTQKLIAIAEQSCDERGHIRYISNQAGIYYVQGHFNKQIEILSNAYNMIRKYQLYRDLLGVISNLALAYMSIAKYSESINLINDGCESIKTYGISVIPPFYHSISAHSFMYLGDQYKNEYEEQINKLGALARQNRNKHSLGHKELISGEYQYFHMVYKESAKHYSKAFAIFHNINAKDDMLDALLKMSLAHRYMNDHEKAREYAKRAAKIFREINCGYLKPLYTYVIALTDYYDNQGTLAPLLEAIDTCRAYGTRELTWQIQFQLAQHYKNVGDISASIKYCRESINTLKEITESLNDSNQIYSYLKVPLRQQVFCFVKSLKP